MAKWFSKTNRRKILTRILPPFAFIFIKILYLTCKKNFHYTTKALETPAIYAAWHGELLMMASGYKEYTNRTDIDSIISRHSDGEMIARLIQLFGGRTIRGSSSKGGSSVLRLALKALESGRDIAITPDGPRGPRHSVAEGIVHLAQMKHVPIMTINCKASSAWRMKSWDAFCIPKPFCTLDFYFGEPFWIDGLEMDAAKALIQKRLLLHAM
jgi:hypothetical protein